MAHNPISQIMIDRSLALVDDPIQSFVERVSAIKDFDETWRAICREFASYGVEYLIYMFMRPSAPEDNALICSSLPGWWSDYYRDADLAKSDPFFKTCFTFAPTGTGRVFNDNNSHLINDDEKKFINEAGETGFISGISSPVRLQNPGHFGGWNFGTPMQRGAFDRYITEHCDRLQLLGFVAHEALQRRASPHQDYGPPKKLSPRERECLLWLARGLHSYEIADRMNLAVVTVDLYFKRIRKKLRAATREEALAKGIVSGEILP